MELPKTPLMIYHFYHPCLLTANGFCPACFQGNMRILGVSEEACERFVCGFSPGRAGQFVSRAGHPL